MMHRIFEGRARPLVGGFAVHESLLDSAAEHQDRAGRGEVAVHAVVARLADHAGDVDRLILDLFADLAFGQGIAAELARQHDERSLQQPPFFQVANELRDWRVDQFLHRGRALVAVLVAVPVNEGDVFRGDLDVTRAALDEAPREQTTLSEPAGVIGVEICLRLERQIERLG